MPTVHSRAYLLIEQQLRHFERNPTPGVQLYPTYTDNLFTLSAKIKGVKGTLWDGAVLKLRLRFSENFNYTPPEANFVTVPFHPNVAADTGRVSCPLLDDPQKWNATVTLGCVLANIRHQLANPDARLVLNEEAAVMMSVRPEQYKKIVAQCVRMSQIVENSPDHAESPVEASANASSLKPRVTIEYDQEFLDRPKTRQAPSQKRISFEDYLAGWAALATSKPAEQPAQPFVPESHWTDPQVLSAKLQEHRQLKYGTVMVSRNANQQLSEKEANLQRVDQMRRLYLSQKQLSSLSARGADAPLNTGVGHYPNDEEADDLLKWTSALPTP